jgi:hypothetical protein
MTADSLPMRGEERRERTWGEVKLFERSAKLAPHHSEGWRGPEGTLTAPTGAPDVSGRPTQQSLWTSLGRGGSWAAAEMGVHLQMARSGSSLKILPQVHLR